MAARLGWVQTLRAPVQHRAYRNAAVAVCGVKLGESPIWTNRARGPCGECLARDPERAEFIEFLIDYLNDVPTMRADRLSVNPIRLAARDFDGAEPFLRTDLTHGGVDSVLGAEPSEVAWPIDLKAIIRIGGRGDDDGLEGADEDFGAPAWTLHRYRSLTPAQARGRVYPSLPYPIEWTMANPAYGDLFQWILGHPKPQIWVPINQSGTVQSSRASGRGRHGELGDVMSDRIMLALGLWKRRRSQWRVYFSIDGQPGIELPSDPVGARAAFRLRDLPEGKPRRAALLHWVSEHWRQARTDPTEERLVREHLAGQREFHWSGITCKISPSRVDQDREAEAVERREEARATSSDRRTRR